MMQILHKVIKSSRKRNESQAFKYLMAAVMNSVVIILKDGDFADVRLARFARVRLLRHALPISLLILRKKPTVLQSNCIQFSF